MRNAKLWAFIGTAIALFVLDMVFGAGMQLLIK